MRRVFALILVVAFFRPVFGLPSFDLETEPFSLSLGSAYGNVALKGFGQSAVYLVSEGARIDLLGAPTERIDEGDRIHLSYQMSGGRTAILQIESGPEQSLRLVFRVDPKTDYEKLGIRFLVGEGEGFVGLMERLVQGSQGLSWQEGTTAALNLRGQTIDLYTLPTVSIYAPFFLSTSGWGAYVQSDWPGTYRFGVDANGQRAPTTLTIEQEGPELRMLLLPGPDPLSIVQRYARISGLSLMPPDFLFGPGRWRDVNWNFPTYYDGSPYTGPFNSMLAEDVLMMDALDIPCSWVVVDRPWASGSFGYGGMQFDESRFPAFTAMVSWLASREIKTLLWLGPWVMDGQRNEARANDYQVSLSLPYLPDATLVDFTNPGAAAWWKTQLTPLLATGISGFKLDRGEEKPPDGQVFVGEYFDGTPYREGHNAYPLWFAQAAHDAAVELGLTDFVSIYRAGWPGLSSVAAAWGGDTDPSVWGLRSAIIALQRAAILNVPIWGSDTGGYNERPSRETLARWLAFSAFCPVMEVGPLANLAPWCWLPDESDSAVSESGVPDDSYYDAELLAIWSFYAQLHGALQPLWIRLAEAAHEDGTPVIRPMFLAYPELEKPLDLWQQYMIGTELLVRPVWEPGAENVSVFLPEGTWVDAWTNERHEGPATITVPVPLHRTPLFLSSDAAVDLGDLNERWTDVVSHTKSAPQLPASLP